jgi:predicted acylesterase/phospholipase RssA/CRP-like cAMP-binding protein
MTVEGTAGAADLDTLLATSSFFGQLDDETRVFVREHLESQMVPGGSVLIHQGDTDDGLYLVALGRLRVSMERDDGSTIVLAELGPGEVVGELALMTNEERSATVTALRDTYVLRLSTESYETLVREHPAALRQITSAVVSRLVGSLRSGLPSSPVVTIAVVPLDEAPEIQQFAERLHASVQRLTGAAGQITAAATAEALGDLDKVAAERLASWFAQHDAGFEVVIHVADPGPTPWTEACVRQADLVLLVASSRSGPHVRPVERAINERRQRVQCRTELLLVHPAGTHDPHGTARWLAVREVDRHHHVRADRDVEVDRAARLLLGRAIGVVFSGGGARGIAGIGALRALEELGVPIDAVGGTSIGSLIGGGVARAQTPDEIADQMRRAVIQSSPFDITFPAVSLATGKRVTQRIKEAAGGLDVEDAWRRYFCVSTNLTRGEPEVHRFGPGWFAVRASFSIPGVFPPVRTVSGDLLVDGGILNNLPVGVLRAEHYGITVIAIDVGRTRDLTAGSLPDGGVVSGWKLLMSRIDPTVANQGETAGLGRILMRITELGSERSDDRGDVYVRPEVDNYSIADFKAFDRLIQLGYEATHETVGKWLASEHAPRF